MKERAYEALAPHAQTPVSQTGHAHWQGALVELRVVREGVSAAACSRRAAPIDVDETYGKCLGQPPPLLGRVPWRDVHRPLHASQQAKDAGRRDALERCLWDAKHLLAAGFWSERVGFRMGGDGRGTPGEGGSGELEVAVNASESKDISRPAFDLGMQQGEHQRSDLRTPK